MGLDTPSRGERREERLAVGNGDRGENCNPQWHTATLPYRQGRSV